MGPHHGARQAAVVPQHPDVLRVVRARLEGVVPPPRAGDVGGAPAGRVGEPLLGAAAAHHHALPAARPDRLFGECVHHQQPRAEVHRAAGARPQPGARRLDCDGAAHLRALAGRRPDQPAVAARRAEADHVQHDRTRPGAGAARAAPHRQRRARGPLGAARQLPPDDVVARRARQDHRGYAGAPAAPAVPLVAVVGAARLLPDRHPAESREDDHRAAQGPQGEHDAVDQQHERPEVQRVRQALQVQEAALRHVLVPRRARRPAQVPQFGVEYPVRFQRCRFRGVRAVLAAVPRRVR
mmetsp:Transcript_61225/g.162009  ORF Transcript_61225/g.162009 Transcript_61225/m.162009 type:complete len:296 (+) Transcript_61225:667-1554(+)